MIITNVTGSYFLKQNDTFTKMRLLVTEADGVTPVDLATAIRLEVVIGVPEGRVLVKTPTVLTEPGQLEFGLDPGDLLPTGDDRLEVHVFYTETMKRVAPSKGYYKLRIQEPIDELAAEVTTFTLDYFINEVNRLTGNIPEIAEQARTLLDELQVNVPLSSEVLAEAREASDKALIASNNAAAANATFDAVIPAAQTATTAAQTATTSANDAATIANTRATQAQTAANNATTATTTATNAAASANQAASIANATVASLEDLQDNLQGYDVAITNFNINTSYLKNQNVRFNGSTYRAKVDTTGNPLPTLPAVENTWWSLVAQRGVDGNGAVASVNGILPSSDGNVDLGDLNANWDFIVGKPTEFTPTQHEHPISQVVDLQDNLDEIKRLLDSEKLANSVTPSFSGFVNNPRTNRYLQSICYIPAENAVLVGYKNYTIPETADRLTDIIKYSLTDFSVIQTYQDLELYHINDMTYNSNTGELTVAVFTAPEGNNVLYVYNYPAMTLNRKVTLTGTGITSSTYIPTIAYNKDDNQYIVYNGTKLLIFSSNFTFVESFDVMRYQNYTLQSMEYYNGHVYIYFDKLIWVYDLKGNRVREWFIDRFGESEGIASLGNGEFLVGNVEINSYTTSSRILKFSAFSGDNTSNWKTYDNLNDLGIVVGTETAESLANAMADKTRLIVQKTSANTASLYPTSSGILEVIKYDKSKTYFTFYSALGTASDRYFATYNINVNPKFSGFVASVNQASLNASVFGIKATLANGTDLNTLTTEGFYTTSSAAVTNSLLNKPNNNAGAGCRLTVTKGVSATVTHQRLEIFVGGATGKPTFKEYTRAFNGSWSQWTLSIHSFVGTGSPEGVITGSIGAIYTDSENGNSPLYYKTTETGNTGWKPLVDNGDYDTRILALSESVAASASAITTLNNTKANKQQQTSLVPTGNAGWDLSNSRYYKDEFGVVHFYLNATVGNRASVTFISIPLPQGYRPSINLVLPYTSYNSSNPVSKPQLMNIPTDGSMFLQDPVDSGSNIAVGYFSFKTTP